MKLSEEQNNILENYCDKYHDRKAERLQWNSLYQLIAYNFMFAEKMSGKNLCLEQFLKDLRKPMKTLVQNLTN